MSRRSKPNYATMNHQARRNRQDGGHSAQLKRIFERDKGICALCSLEVFWETGEASRDHVKGFAECETIEEIRADENMQLAHVVCNNLKSQQLKGGIPRQPTEQDYIDAVLVSRMPKEERVVIPDPYQRRLRQSMESAPGFEKLKDLFRGSDE